MAEQELSRQNSHKITGNIVDIPGQRIYPGVLEVEAGKIQSIRPLPSGWDPDPDAPYILPGFVDAHVHIESSMLVPAEFARLAVVHGTVATVSDPHEIANVCGAEGVDFMIRNGQTVPFKFLFGAPSCVPATVFETAGAELDAMAVTALLEKPEIYYLSEMMNFPGVLNKDPEVMRKIEAAHSLGKPVDGHAPGLRGEEARSYAAAGISTDHECFTREEALDKLAAGMHILIREGSAARNFEALIELLHDYPEKIMFCSDDKHPDSLAEGHINQLCARAVAKGIDLFKVLRAACINPVQHYRAPVGLLQPGDPADFILLKDLAAFEVMATYVDGIRVAASGQSFIESNQPEIINRFECQPRTLADFEWKAPDNTRVPVIEALDGQLITRRIECEPSLRDGQLLADPERDLLKLVVINRYKNAPVARALIRNFGLRSGALASSVAHDSHNIVAVGADDASLCRAVNLVIAARGGISCVEGSNEKLLPLPVAGLMSDQDGYRVAKAYTALDRMAHDLGSKLRAPFMTLSFMALLVIPHLKLSDLGLFDGDRFEFIR